MRMLALLNLHLREEHGWCNCGDGHLSAFRATNAVENVLLVAGQHDPRESRERRPHNVHTAHQFIGPAVRVNLIDDHRKNLESLWQRPSGQSEASLNVVEV